MTRAIRVAAIQMVAEPAPTSQRLERAEALVAQAAGHGAQPVFGKNRMSTQWLWLR